MKKKEFLKELLLYLRWSFTNAEIKDVLSDYDSFFELGITEGKSEQAICAEFGEPSAVAIELSKSLGRKIFSPPSTKAIRSVSLVIALILIGLVFYFTFNFKDNIIGGSIVSVAGVSFLTWLLLGGKFSIAFPLLSTEKESRWCVVALHILLAAFVMVNCFILYTLNTRLVSGMEVLMVASFSEYIRIAFTLAALLVAIFSIISFYQFKPHSFQLLIHSVGVVVYFNASHFYLAGTDTAFLDEWTVNILAVYGFAIVSSFIYGLIIHNYQKRLK